MFKDVLRSSKCDIFCKDLTLRISFWSFLGSYLIILDQFWKSPNFSEFQHFWHHFRHLLSTAELSSHPLELKFIFSGTWRSFLHRCTLILSEDPLISRTKHLKLKNYTFPLKPWFHPSGPSETMMKESASHHMITLISKKQRIFFMNIVRQHRKFDNVGVMWRIFLAPRRCFKNVLRSSKCDIFCEALTQNVFL